MVPRTDAFKMVDIFRMIVKPLSSTLNKISHVSLVYDGDKGQDWFDSYQAFAKAAYADGFEKYCLKIIQDPLFVPETIFR